MSRKLTTDTDLTAIADAIRAKGGTSAPLVYPTEFVSAISAIKVGVDTSDANATSNDMLNGKTAYVDGQKITGNIPSKSSANLTALDATITAPAGYYSIAATKTISNGSTIQNAPIINSSTGLVTATATVTAGYQASDTKSNTLQLTTQAEQTITPGTTNQTISSGRYLTGTQTIKGDANLVASNIAEGVSIFGVTGTHSSADPTDFIENRDTWTSYENLSASKIGAGVFAYCNNKLSNINFPACTSIGSYAFCNCTDLTSVNFPACTNIGNSAFTFCYNLSTVSFPVCTSINSKAFCECFNLTSLYLTGSSYVSLANSNAFSYTPIGGSSSTAGQYGSIYVPASMLASYKTRTNWTYFSSRFVGV